MDGYHSFDENDWFNTYVREDLFYLNDVDHGRGNGGVILFILF